MTDQRPTVLRVAYHAGKELPDGTFETHPSDHVTFQMPDGSLKDGYRFERDQRPEGCSKGCTGRMCRDALHCDAPIRKGTA